MYEFLVVNNGYVYLLLAALFLFSSFLIKVKGRFFFGLLALLLTLIAGVRYGVGYDYFAYLEASQDVKLADRFELLPRVLLYFSEYLQSHQFFFVSSSLLIYGFLFFSFYRYSKHSFLALFVFFSFPFFYLMSLGIVRQFMAIGFTTLAICVLYKNNNENKNNNIVNLKVFVLTMLAFFSHLSSVVVVVALVFRRAISTSWSLLFKFFAFAVVIFSSSFLLDFISEVYPYYAFYLSENDTQGYKVLYLLALLAIFSHFSVANYKYDKLMVAHDNLFFLGVCVYGSLISLGTAPARVSFYFLIFMCFSLSSVVSGKYFKIKRLLFICFLLLLYSMSIYFASNNPARDPLLPYRFFFDAI